MGRRTNKRPADDDLTGVARVFGSSDDTSQPNRKKKRIKKMKSSVVTPSDESSRQIDDAIESVLSQSLPQSQMDDDIDLDTSVEIDNQQLKSTVLALAGKVKDQQATINKLTSQVDFLLSYLGVTNPQVGRATNVADTSLGGSGATASPPAGSSSSSAPAPVSGSATVQSLSLSSAATTAVTYSKVTNQRPAPLSSALQQAVVSAVYRDFEDRDRRNRNVVISGIPVTEPNDVVAVQQLLEDQFGRTYTVTKCRRLGHPMPGKYRPVLATMSTVVEAQFLVQNSKLLRQSTNDHVRASVYINPDVTRAEAYAAYQSRCERRRRAAARPRDQSSTAAVAPASAHPSALSAGSATSALVLVADSRSSSSPAQASTSVQLTAPSNPPSSGLSTGAVPTAEGDAQ